MLMWLSMDLSLCLVWTKADEQIICLSILLFSCYYFFSPFVSFQRSFLTHGLRYASALFIRNF